MCSVANTIAFCPGHSETTSRAGPHPLPVSLPRVIGTGRCFVGGTGRNLANVVSEPSGQNPVGGAEKAERRRTPGAARPSFRSCSAAKPERNEAQHRDPRLTTRDHHPIRGGRERDLQPRRPLGGSLIVRPRTPFFSAVTKRPVSLPNQISGPCRTAAGVGSARNPNLQKRLQPISLDSRNRLYLLEIGQRAPAPIKCVEPSS